MKFCYTSWSFVLNIACVFVLLLLYLEFLLTTTKSSISLEKLLKALLGDGIFKGKKNLDT